MRNLLLLFILFSLNSNANEISFVGSYKGSYTDYTDKIDVSMVAPSYKIFFFSVETDHTKVPSDLVKLIEKEALEVCSKNKNEVSLIDNYDIQISKGINLNFLASYNIVCGNKLKI